MNIGLDIEMDLLNGKDLRKVHVILFVLLETAFMLLKGE